MRAQRSAPLAWKSEDIEPSSRLGALWQVAHRIDEAERGARVVRIERCGDEGTGPAADSGHHRDIFASIRPAIGDRLADDSGIQLELPKEVPIQRVDRFEPAVHRAVEDDV